MTSQRKLSEFRRNNIGRVKCTAESIMFALVEEMMDSAILNNHEIRPSSLLRFNDMSFCAQGEHVERAQIFKTKCRRPTMQWLTTVSTLAAWCMFTVLTLSVVLSVSVFIRVIWAVYRSLLLLCCVCALWNWCQRFNLMYVNVTFTQNIHSIFVSIENVVIRNWSFCWHSK